MGNTNQQSPASYRESIQSWVESGIPSSFMDFGDLDVSGDGRTGINMSWTIWDRTTLTSKGDDHS